MIYLTPTQQRLLMHLSKDGATLHRELAEHLEVHRSAISRTLKGLAELHLVDQDGRKGTRLTPKGHVARSAIWNLNRILVLESPNASGKSCLECCTPLTVSDLDAPVCPHCGIA